MRRATALFAALLMSLLTIASATIAQAGADSCVGDWSIGIGGSGDSIHSVFAPFVDQAIGYESTDSLPAMYELDRLFWSHRAECPSDHIRLIGHSEGSAIIHAWITAHPNVADTNAILLADPKRAPGPGDAGLSATPGNLVLGYPLAGVDDWFGTVPVLTVCNHDDQICDTSAGWWGYVFAAAHERYDFDVHDYGRWDSGVWYR
ncbi:hypothetical protein ACWELJ_07190 [Nocardia sp. NPDC004582]